MFELIRDILKMWILRRTPPIELRRSKLESLAREFSASATGDTMEARIRDSFRLGRIWLAELDGEGTP
jgi:hypothetical protein